MSKSREKENMLNFRETRRGKILWEKKIYKKSKGKSWKIYHRNSKIRELSTG